MKLFKRISAIFLAAAMTFIIAACDPATPGGDSSSGYGFAGENSFDATVFSDLSGKEDGVQLPFEYYLPKINIVTENKKSIDDRSLIDTTKKKGLNNEIPVYNFVNAIISVNGCGEYNLENEPAQVKVRGNYTSTYEKKPIRIKFNKKQSMCGLNGGQKFKNWVLLSEYRDSSMLRNSVAFYLGNRLFKDDNYCSDCCYAEVFLNGAYYGLFLLCEQQEVKEGRVDVDVPLDPSDYPTPTPEQQVALENERTGYFFEYDGYYKQEDELHRAEIDFFPSLFGINAGQWSTPIKLYNGHPLNPTNHGTIAGFTVHSDVYFENQRDYLEKCLQSVWNVVLDACYSDHSDLNENPYHTMDKSGNFVASRSITDAKQAVASVIDLDSLYAMYTIQELFADSDLAWSSFFFSLDMSADGKQKLVYTAPWDFDSSMGLTSSASNRFTFFVMNNNNPWLVVFINQKWFWEGVVDLWNEMTEDGVFDRIADRIDVTSECYEEAFSRNFARWPNSIGAHVPGGSQVKEVLDFKTQKDAAKYLKKWLDQRIKSLTELFADRLKKTA